MATVSFSKQFAGEVSEWLKQTVEEFLESATEALVADVVSAAKRLAPVDTGALRASIRARIAQFDYDPDTGRLTAKLPGVFRGHERIQKGTLAGNIVIGILEAGNAMVPYAARIEYGYGQKYSFLWPAVYGEGVRNTRQF